MGLGGHVGPGRQAPAALRLPHLLASVPPPSWWRCWALPWTASAQREVPPRSETDRPWDGQQQAGLSEEVTPERVRGEAKRTSAGRALRGGSGHTGLSVRAAAAGEQAHGRRAGSWREDIYPVPVRCGARVS